MVVAAAALALVVGCARPIAGVAEADPAVVAQLTQERNCRAAGDRLVAAVSAGLERTDRGGVTSGAEVSAMLREMSIRDLGRDLGRQCGPALVGPAYSRVLVQVSALTFDTFLGRQSQQAALDGMCTGLGDGANDAITLTGRARLICAGR